VARQEEVRPLDYVLFDCTFFNGIDVRQKSYSSRRAHLFRSIGCVNLEVNAALEAEQSTHDALVAHGYEGTIAKLLLGPYVNNACGKGWYKFKAVFEMDAIITGFIPGTPGSAFDGKIGGIVFAQPGNDGQLIDRGSASGLTLMLRDEISLDPDVYIGEVVAIKHMGLMPDGIHVRHPQFSRWRPDKLSTQVRWAER
jgi:ATP-dependent DNA ligase